MGDKRAKKGQGAKIMIYKFFRPEIVQFFGGKREMETEIEKFAEEKSGLKNNY